MEAYEAVCKRASVRSFDAKAIERTLLERLVDAGRRAPSARAIEPWEFVVISGKGKLDKLYEMASSNAPFMKEAQACIAVFCRETKYYLEDGVAATENILIEACNLGLGACWVAGDKKPYAEEVSRLLGAPEGLKLVSLVALGWPRFEVKQKKKRSVEEVIHWENF